MKRIGHGSDPGASSSGFHTQVSQESKKDDNGHRLEMASVESTKGLRSESEELQEVQRYLHSMETDPVIISEDVSLLMESTATATATTDIDLDEMAGSMLHVVGVQGERVVGPPRQSLDSGPVMFTAEGALKRQRDMGLKADTGSQEGAGRGESPPGKKRKPIPKRVVVRRPSPDEDTKKLLAAANDYFSVFLRDLGYDTSESGKQYADSEIKELLEKYEDKDKLVELSSRNDERFGVQIVHMLCLAGFSKSIDYLRVLISEKFDERLDDFVNAKTDMRKMTPLMMACCEGKEDMISYWMENEADIFKKDSDSESFIFYLVRYCLSDDSTRLLDKLREWISKCYAGGSNYLDILRKVVNEQSGKYRYPVIFECCHVRPKKGNRILELLLDFGAEVLVPALSGYGTLFHMAVLHKREDVILCTTDYLKVIRDDYTQNEVWMREDSDKRTVCQLLQHEICRAAFSESGAKQLKPVFDAVYKIKPEIKDDLKEMLESSMNENLESRINESLEAKLEVKLRSLLRDQVVSELKEQQKSQREVEEESRMEVEGESRVETEEEFGMGLKEKHHRWNEKIESLLEAKIRSDEAAEMKERLEATLKKELEGRPKEDLKYMLKEDLTIALKIFELT